MKAEIQNISSDLFKLAITWYNISEAYYIQFMRIRTGLNKTSDDYLKFI